MLVIACVGGLGNHLRNMCLLDHFFDLSTVTDKHCMDFMLEHVYTDMRSWHNWLQIEYQYSARLNPLMPVQHPDYTDTQWRVQPTVFTTVDPETCYHHYVKFNSNLNNLTKRYFLELTQQHMDHWRSIADTHDNVTALAVDDLFDGELEQFWLDQLNTALGLHIDYRSANVVHAKWQKLNRRAEQQLVKHMIKEYPDAIDTSN